MTKYHLNIKSFTVCISTSEMIPRSTPVTRQFCFSTPQKNIHLSVTPATDKIIHPDIHHNHDIDQYYVLGDDQDLMPNVMGLQYLGNGVMLRCNTPRREIEITSSITGLPAVFIYQDNKNIIISSEIQNIAAIPGLKLEFDPKSLTELATIGHPINHRTLFKNIVIIPAGSHLKFKNDTMSVVDNWQPSYDPAYTNWPEYIDAQINATRNAVRRLDLSQSFLSLTAGLDTRAIFALLVQENARVPAYTMSGDRVSLDAMRAGQLAQAYGLSHNKIIIDSEFVEKIPQYAVEASRLSGGLESLGQAFEVYFYNAVHNELTARISGNLGNQIGRSGTEGTGMRNANLSILNPDMRVKPPGSTGEHWFNEIFPDQKMMHPLFLIQNENLYASVGNYCIGNHFAVQQTPYADRTVINQKLRQPPIPRQANQQDAIWKIKLRDIRHRFLGQPVEYSFQRKIVKDTGGFVANCPINWGWRARGGVSVGGLIYGAMAITDAALGSRLKHYPLSGKLLKLAGIQGLSGFQEVNVLENPKTWQFVADTLLSSAFLQSGIVQSSELRGMIDSSMTGTINRSGIEFSLDVALAQHNFLTNN